MAVTSNPQSGRLTIDVAETADGKETTVRFRNFTVLPATDCPAVLVETAFLSNAADCALFTDPVRQVDFAAAIAAAMDGGN